VAKFPARENLPAVWKTFPKRNPAPRPAACDSPASKYTTATPVRAAALLLYLTAIPDGITAIPSGLTAIRICSAPSPA